MKDIKKPGEKVIMDWEGEEQQRKNFNFKKWKDKLTK